MIFVVTLSPRGASPPGYFPSRDPMKLRPISLPALTKRPKILVRIVDEILESGRKFMVNTTTPTSETTPETTSETTPESVSEAIPKKIVAGFHALSDPLRIQVLELLRQQELCVCELCKHLVVHQSKLSFHMRTLKDAGLIRGRQEGRWIYYSLNLPQFLELEQYLAEYRRFGAIAPGRQCAE